VLINTEQLPRQAFSFCWSCKTEWKSGWTVECKSDQCTQSSRAHILKTCPDMVLLPYQLTVPEVRACPTCHALIHHAGQCKMMTCPAETCGVKKKFCFVCLQVMNAQGSCGGSYTKCQPAPRQTLGVE
jgi:hypothetical protein